MQSEQTMAEQEAALERLRAELAELGASSARLEQALAASTAESQATIEALRSSMACASSEALELAQRRHAQQSVLIHLSCALMSYSLRQGYRSTRIEAVYMRYMRAARIR